MEISLQKGFVFLLITTSTLAFSEASRPVVTPPPRTVAVAASPTQYRSLSSEVDSLVVEPSWWKASLYNYSIGYETGTNTTGVLGQNVITGGAWLNNKFGYDLFLGYTKAANAQSESISESTNTISAPNTKVATTSYAGLNSAHNITLAGAVKYRLVQTDWFQLNIGFMLAVYTPTSVDSSTGTKAETYADIAVPGNRTVTETAFGTINTKTSSQLAMGPRIGTEFYLKWFPHLAVGFATGIVTTVFGNVETTTNTHTRSYTVTGGVDGTPTTDTLNHTVSRTRPGLRGTTFGIGGTTFAFTGTFSIRYVW